MWWRNRNTRNRMCTCVCAVLLTAAVLLSDQSNRSTQPHHHNNNTLLAMECICMCPCTHTCSECNNVSKHTPRSILSHPGSAWTHRSDTQCTWPTGPHRTAQASLRAHTPVGPILTKIFFVIASDIPRPPSGRHSCAHTCRHTSSSTHSTAGSGPGRRRRLRFAGGMCAAQPKHGQSVHTHSTHSTAQHRYLLTALEQGDPAVEVVGVCVQAHPQLLFAVHRRKEEKSR
jgi:hypothetical protein